MNARPSLLTSALLFAATLLFAASASAQLNYTMPSAGGTMMIGRFDLGNGTFQHRAYFKNSVGNCTYVGQVGNGSNLTMNVTITGTTGADTMVSADGNTTFCGFNVQPTVMGSATVTFNGGSGADMLAGRATTINGNGGDDYILSSNTVTWFAYGGSNNDYIYISNGGFVFGDGGDDRMCTTSTNYSAWFDGGTGVDLYCGIPLGPVVSADPAGPGSCPQMCIKL